MTIDHETWTVERTFPASRERVFAAWADVSIKRRWFVGPDGDPNDDLSLDFRVGGGEEASGTTPAGDRYTYRAQIHDIVEQERIVTTSVMTMNDRRISVSIETVELFDHAGGTRLVRTEQDVFLDGLDDASARRGGVGTHLDHLGEVLAEEQ